MKHNDTYAIGKAGVKWGPVERAQWLALQHVKRSYSDDVLSQLDALGSQFDIKEYARLDYASGALPVFALRNLNWDPSKESKKDQVNKLEPKMASKLVIYWALGREAKWVVKKI